MIDEDEEWLNIPNAELEMAIIGDSGSSSANVGQEAILK